MSSSGKKKEHDDAMTVLKREHQKEIDRLLAEREKLLTSQITELRKPRKQLANDEQTSTPEGLF